MSNRPIGLFDSGVGGLTVFKQLVELMPSENTVYFGDTARFPYGTKSKEEILKYSTQIINFLKTMEVKAVIIACNTVSSSCYNELKNMFDIPIIDIVSAGAIASINSTKNLKIGILATEATVKTGQYKKFLKNIKPAVEVFSVSCPEFAILAEKGLANSKHALKTAKKYILPLLEKEIDTLVLGCTHYPLLIETINQIVPKNISIVDPAVNLIKNTKDILNQKNILNLYNRYPKNQFFISKNSQNFNSISNLIFNKQFDIKNINIDIF